MDQLAIARRPQANPTVRNNLRKVNLLTNYYKFNFSNPDKKHVFKYNVKFTPDIPDNSKKCRNKLVNQLRESLSASHLGFFIFLGGSCIYSLENSPEIPTQRASIDEVEYEIDITWVQCIAEKDNDMLVFLKVFFNSMLKKIRFKQIGRNFFNPGQSTQIPHHQIEIWPGFSSSLQMLERGVLLNVDIVHKVLRTDTVLDFISDIKNRCRGDLPTEIKKALIGVTILTSYNKRTYKVDDIDFEKSPKDTFVLDAEGAETTYHEYFRNKYQANVTDMNQPVIISINQKTGTKIVLIPELCQMTGLTDSMRANFQLMKEMSHTTHADARKRVQECKSLLEMFNTSEKCSAEMQNWQISIENEPSRLTGHKVAAGEMLMGKTNFDLEQCPDLDRKIQAQMLEQPPLLTWGVFFCEQDRRTASMFLETMEKCFDQISYRVNKPRQFPVRSNRFQDWERELRGNLNSKVQAVVLILPGAKGKAPLYDDLKRLLLKDLPVPSQVVLANTISRGKNVRSICSKILIQICAKIGGEPWAISNMPFFDRPAMVCGIDVYHKIGNGNKSILAFTASMNKRATQFWSGAKIQDEGQEIGNSLEDLMTQALTEFKKKNTVFPANVVIYRDGVGDSQRKAVLLYELPQLQAAIRKVFGVTAESSEELPCKLLVCLVNKRVSQRFFDCQNPNRLTNPMPGTIVDTDVVAADTYDFFLVSQISRQGVVSPTHYVIVYDNTGRDPNEIQQLTYKLCYTYYNVAGSIKVPAPIQYAHRLANLIGDRAKGNNLESIPIPHAHFGQAIKSLYFI